jgi:hypothetical protein
MGVTVDHRTNGGAFGSVATASWNHTVGAALSNSALTVEVQNESSGAPSNVQWDTTGTPASLTKEGSANFGNAPSTVSLWSLLSPSSGTKQITVTWSSAPIESSAGSASYKDVDQTTPWNAASPQSTSGTAGGSTATLTVTSATNEMVIACIGAEDAVTLSPTGVQNPIHSDAGTFTSGASADLAGAASVAMTWTGLNNGDPYGIIGGSLRFAGSGPNVKPGVGQLTLTGYAPSVFTVSSTERLLARFTMPPSPPAGLDII